MISRFFYFVVRVMMRFALKLFCIDIVFSGVPIRKVRGPLLLACNHPNSFFDAIVIGCCVGQPVHFLARGEAFGNSFARMLFRALNLVPIYKPGADNNGLLLNEESFARCEAILSAGGIVLVFAEGNCKHEWALRPLKKSAARVALNAWNNPLIADRFRVLPVVMNYNSFGRMGKKILIDVGEPVILNDLPQHTPDAAGIHAFNRLLKRRLEKGMLKGAGDETTVQLLVSNKRRSDVVNGIGKLDQNKFLLQEQGFLQHTHALVAPYLLPSGFGGYMVSLLFVFVFAAPAIFGWLVHASLYYPMRGWIRQKTNGTVYFDAVFFVSLLVVYPIYWILIIGICMIFIKQDMAIALAVLMPLFGWISLRWRDELQKIINYISLPKKQRRSIDEVLY